MKIGDLVKRKDSDWYAIVVGTLPDEMMYSKAKGLCDDPDRKLIVIRWVDTQLEDSIDCRLLELVSESR